MKIILQQLVSISLLIVSVNTYAASSDSFYWFNNQVSFSFYDNSFLSPDIPIPHHVVFWKASFAVDTASSFSYQRLIYHSKKYFGLYAGTDITQFSYAGSTNNTLSAYLAMHLYLFRTRFFNPYFSYSIAGPTYLFKNPWEQANFSNHFVFQDMMGLGASFSPKVPLNLGFNIAHYSNGDIFPRNSGIQVPFEIFLAYSF